jgi:hypothetical protein
MPVMQMRQGGVSDCSKKAARTVNRRIGGLHAILKKGIQQRLPTKHTTIYNPALPYNVLLL